MLVFQIKSDKIADFESAWGSIRAAFAKVTKPEAKAFGDTMAKLYKVDVGGGAPAPVTIYVVQLDAAVQDVQLRSRKDGLRDAHGREGAHR